MYQWKCEEEFSDEEEYTYTYEDEDEYEEDEEIEEIHSDYIVNFCGIQTPTTTATNIECNNTVDVNETIFIPQLTNIERLLNVPQDVLDKELNKLEDLVWISDIKQPYQLCKVFERNDSQIVIGIQTESGLLEKKNVNASNTFPASLSHYCSDMCNLTEINEPSVLHTIRCRYDLKLIHTYSGLFCVVVNPWQNIPIYTEEIIDYYMNQTKVEQNLPPHIYSIAQNAYDGIALGTMQKISSNNSQSILITGESGAGKTENTKKIIEYLICCAGKSSSLNDSIRRVRFADQKPNNFKLLSTQKSLDAAILNAGIALEAFSNATTVHNNNSSRLGKFIRLDFDENAKLCSARIDCYLLEKSRVVNQNEGDRNFHIFYQIFTSALCDSNERKNLGLFKNVSDYRFLKMGACINVDGIDDYENAIMTNKALKQLEFTDLEKSFIINCIAACILTGEIRFNERQGLDMSYVENSSDVDSVAKLIGVNSGKLIDALTQPTIKVGDNIIRKNQNLKKTLSSAAAFAKVIYERMFMWIVKKCNATIKAMSKNNVNSLSSTKDTNMNFIGVLDMAGFEIMSQNSFEQFCINYTNEKLQQFFNHVLFVKELNEYVDEGIEWNQVNYGNDLQPTIDFIEMPMGFLSLLQEECIVPNGKDSSLLEKLLSNSSNKVFTKAKFSSNKILTPLRTSIVNHFVIHHYAGPVSYNIDGWVEKNRDLVDQCVLEVLSNSTDTQISQLFPKIQQEMTKYRRGSFATSTISCIYKEQLGDLLQTLHSSTAHFIRCIVPNYERKPFVLNGSLVMNQLKCNGVLEGIRVYRRGFPNRILFGEFLRRYNLLNSTNHINAFSNSNERLAVENLCKNLGIDYTRFNIGHTKIFCRTGLISELENQRKERINKTIIHLQAWIRWYFAQKYSAKKLEEFNALTQIQDAIRNYVTLLNWPWFKLWLKIRNLIPLAKDRKRLHELEIISAELEKENKELKNNLEETTIKKIAIENRMDALIKEREIGQQKIDELRMELKRNEDLLELMEKKFDDQHAKIMRLNTSLNENLKSLEKLEEEKHSTESQLESLTKRYSTECEARFIAEETLRNSCEESKKLQTKLDSLFNDLKKVETRARLTDEEVLEWKDKCNHQIDEINSLNRALMEANEKVNKCENILHEERNMRRKYDAEIEELEDETNYLRCELDKANVKREAMKEQVRVKENSIKKLERKLEDKTMEMESCIMELKKMHKTTQTELQTQLEELKRKCMKLEMENKQQKSLLEAATASATNNFSTNNLFERESSVDSDYRTSTLGRYGNHRNLLSNSTMSISGYGNGSCCNSASSIRTLSSRRRDTEPELQCLANNRNHNAEMSSSTYGSLLRSSSNFSSTTSIRLSRNMILGSLTNSMTTTIDSGLARSSSSSSNATSQLQSSERKVIQLERDLHTAKTDGNLMKREVEVYKEALKESEKSKDALGKQIKSLNIEIERLTSHLKAEEEKTQQLTFDTRKSANDCIAWKKRLEDTIQESQNDLCTERKKHSEKMEELKHNYELKLHHLSTTNKNFDKLQNDLAETQTQLDKSIAQIAQMERMQKSQSAIGETWESQYRCAMQDIESLRDENAALKSKIRRQYKQIELLTQQSEMNEYVSDLETKVDNLHDRVEKSASIMEMPTTTTQNI